MWLEQQVLMVLLVLPVLVDRLEVQVIPGLAECLVFRVLLALPVRPALSVQLVVPELLER